MILPIVIGIYGVSGSGKSRVLSEVQKIHPEWRCMDGSEVIDSVMLKKGKLPHDFSSMDESAKKVVRTLAIESIKRYQGVTIVAGHCSFPFLKDENCPTKDIDIDKYNDVFTRGDGITYDAIFYLDKPHKVIYQQRKDDNDSAKRERPKLSEQSIKDWSNHEKMYLKSQCTKYDIQFALCHDRNDITNRIEQIVLPNISQVKKTSNEALRAAIKFIPKAEVFLLIDGDRTLCPEDSGAIFMDRIMQEHCFLDVDPLKKIFQRYSNYNFQSFLEVAMFYERIHPEEDYKKISKEIGRNQINIYVQWMHMLSNLPENVHPVVVSSGNREVWQTALEFHNFSLPDKDNKMSIIAGNHIGLHSYIVDSDAKSMVVSELRERWAGCKILSFGDSAIDVPMLKASDRGYIVVDNRKNRSMKDFIEEAVESGDCKRLYQLCLSKDFSHVHTGIQIGSLESLLKSLTNGSINNLYHYDKGSKAAAVLATKTRQSDLSGPRLQIVHQDVGKFLGNKLMDEFPNAGFIQKVDLSHVQGNAFSGLATSANILILPLMRGGEPLARGIYDQFPLGKLIHYNDEKTQGFLRDFSNALTTQFNATKLQTEIVIVDSVINEGKSIRCAIRYLEDAILAINNKQIWCRPRIYVVTAVIQKEASLCLPSEFPLIRFLALRISDNKYKGKGGTDTGNRLFGTF